MTIRPIFKTIARAIVRDRESGWMFTGTAVVLYLAFLIWMHIHHEMWRDEIHAWTLSRLAEGFGDLITGDRRYEGHPPLWFWYLHILSWFTKEAWGIQLATIMAATFAAVLLLRFAPFPRYLKVLLLFSYYFGYEYTVMSRNYVLGWLFLCAFCAAYHPLRFRYLLLAATLALLSMTSIYGLLMTLSLLIFLVIDQARVTFSPNRPAYIRLSVSSKIVAPFLIVSAGIVFCSVTLQPSEPNVFAPDWHFQYLTLNAVPRMLTRIVAGFLPLRHYAIDFWNSSDAIWDRNAWHLGIVGGGILLMSLFALLPSWRLIVVYLGCVLAMELLQQVRYEGHPRHWGQYWVLFVGVCWLLRSSFPRRRHVVSLLSCSPHRASSYKASSRRRSGIRRKSFPEAARPPPSSGGRGCKICRLWQGRAGRCSA
jgi:hypothetical protein